MKKISLLLLTLVVLGACTSTQEVSKDLEKDSNIYMAQPVNMLKGLPEWTFNPQIKGSESAIGMVKITQSGRENARKKALSRARVELASQMEIKVEAMTKDYLNIVGHRDNEVVEGVFSEVSKQVSKQTLTGSRQIDIFETKENELYVLVAIPESTVKESIKDAIDSSIDKLKDEDKVYQEFKAEEAQKELEVIIEKKFGNEE